VYSGIPALARRDLESTIDLAGKLELEPPPRILRTAGESSHGYADYNSFSDYSFIANQLAIIRSVLLFSIESITKQLTGR
jgi:hypothetical protein